MTKCDEIVIVTDILSNSIATKKTNVTISVSINYHNKGDKRLLYFAYSFISDLILLLT